MSQPQDVADRVDTKIFFLNKYRSYPFTRQGINAWFRWLFFGL